MGAASGAPVSRAMTTLGFGFLDRPGVREQLRLAAKAEALGYDSLWVTETRLARDAVSVLGAMAATTERVRLGSCIVNSWTRGPALMAMTFATLDNLAPGRMNLGLGAYWDPLAWKQGIERRKPLSQMREYVGVLRRLLRAGGRRELTRASWSGCGTSPSTSATAIRACRPPSGSSSAPPAPA